MEQQVGPEQLQSSQSVIFKHFRIHPTDHELHHYRRGKDRKTSQPLTPWMPKERGGLTICALYDGDDLIGLGQARCSMKDQFCYRLGRQIAKGRALKTRTAYKALKELQLREVLKAEEGV